jgi:hypothetical protein
VSAIVGYFTTPQFFLVAYGTHMASKFAPPSTARRRYVEVEFLKKSNTDKIRKAINAALVSDTYDPVHLRDEDLATWLSYVLTHDVQSNNVFFREQQTIDQRVERMNDTIVRMVVPRLERLQLGQVQFQRDIANFLDRRQGGYAGGAFPDRPVNPRHEHWRFDIGRARLFADEEDPNEPLVGLGPGGVASRSSTMARLAQQQAINTHFTGQKLDKSQLNKAWNF